MKCATVGCGDSLAIVRVFWPGRSPMLMCLPCAQRTVVVGAAMGFTLHTEMAVTVRSLCETLACDDELPN